MSYIPLYEYLIASVMYVKGIRREIILRICGNISTDIITLDKNIMGNLTMLNTVMV